jgi:hypothetical protein
MSIRKRSWQSGGETREAWVVDYVAGGKRHLKTFSKKKDADAYRAQVQVDIRQGKHVAPSASITVEQAGANWISSGEMRELERAVIKIQSWVV